MLIQQLLKFCFKVSFMLNADVALLLDIQPNEK